MATSTDAALRRPRRAFSRLLRWPAAALTLTVLSQVAVAAPARAAAEEISLSEIRETAVRRLVDGGPSVKRAAEAALLGSADGLRAFYDTGAEAADEADGRAAAQVLAGMDGPAMRSAARQLADKPATDVWAFVDGGWQQAWKADERLRVYRVLQAGGPTVRAAAQRALDGSDADVAQFMSSGREAATYADDRLAATRMLTGGANNSGPVLDAAASRALAGTREDLAEFLVAGQYVARARDRELASVKSLVEQARQAGATTSQEALAAEESSTRAGNAAAEAKAAADAAEREARAAQGDAAKASAAAGRAADAADGAAEAAREAVAASNAAMRAARVAADAARKATTAAALTAQAAARAQKAAAAARLNAGDAHLAREAAEAARDAAAKARELEQVRAERDRAMSQAQRAAAAAKQAGANADAAGVAADEAGRQSGVSDRQAQRARAAAAQARAAAQQAGRAADRAENLARQAAEASAEAFAYAQSAAQHADNAVTQAIAAADAAERGQLSAAEAARHAQAAVDAANVAVQAANQAVELEALARAEDEARLAEWTDQGIQAAQAAAQAEAEAKAAGGELVAWNQGLLWDTAEQDRIAPATRTLLAEATAAGAPADVVLDRGRRAAMALLTTGGEWTRAAAEEVLTGGEVEMRSWLADGRRFAAGQDDRARLWRLVDTLPEGAERTAAQAALDGDDTAVETFLRTRSYSGKVARDRQEIYRVINGAGTNLRAAGERALAGTPADMHQFLRTGQQVARAADERLEVYRVMADGGPEVKAAAQVALNGPASYLSYFLTTSRYQAQQRDLEQAAHVATVRRLLAEAQQYAQKALEDADRAVEAAKRAQGFADEANAAKARADAAARAATDAANRAAASAQDAQASAERAAESAVTARNAANAADASAARAAQSAATASAAAKRARADAAAAYQAKAQARHYADAAGKDAAAADAAAKEAAAIYDRRLKEMEEQRRSTEPGSGPGGEGTANDHHKRWECLSLSTDAVSAECLSVYKDFASAAMNPAKCAVPANANSPGCLMVRDLSSFVQENPDVLLDALQLALMGCGLIPGAGEVCDGIDAAVSFSRGDVVGGILSLGAMIPVAGWLASGLKGFKNSDKFRNIIEIINKIRRTCNSFLPGTRVLLPDGRTERIEDLRAGDQVVATDPVTGVTAAKPITGLITGAGVKQLAVIRVDDDRDARTPPVTITATGNHPFWMPARKAWVPAASLAAGQSVRSASGATLAVASVSVRNLVARVHNLEVADIHTYYVVAGKATVLVHNGCGPNAASRPGQIASHFGYTTKQVKDAIHAVKRKGLPRDGAQRNPDVIVDLDSGEVYIKMPDGNPSDESIGNILDELPDE